MTLVKPQLPPGQETPGDGSIGRLGDRRNPDALLLARTILVHFELLVWGPETLQCQSSKHKTATAQLLIRVSRGLEAKTVDQLWENIRGCMLPCSVLAMSRCEPSVGIVDRGGYSGASPGLTTMSSRCVQPLSTATSSFLPTASAVSSLWISSTLFVG